MQQLLIKLAEFTLGKRHALVPVRVSSRLSRRELQIAKIRARRRLRF